MENSWDNYKGPQRSNVSPVDVVGNSYGHGMVARNDSVHSPVLNVGLRVLTGIWAAIVLAIIALNKAVLITITDYHVRDTFHICHKKQFSTFFMSYLLVVNMICFAYVLVTTILFIWYRRESFPSGLLLGISIFDQILAYLLMSAATSAATGTRIVVQLVPLEVPHSFDTKSYACVGSTFIAFCTMAAAAMITGR